MPLLKAGAWTEDGWRTLAEGEAWPIDGAVIVPFARCLAEVDGVAGTALRLGARLGPADRVEKLEPYLARLELVALEFPSYTDGRAYSTARILRQRYGFEGEIRAVGKLLVDYYGFMRQCGFDAFEVALGRAQDAWERAHIQVGLAYQPDYAGTDGIADIWRARQRRPALAAE